MQECDIMPEGPEVKKITEKLNQSLAGKTITQIDIVDESYKANQMSDEVDDFMATLPHTIDSVQCKGKFIYWTLDGGEWHIWHTLGMSGTWRYGNTKQKGIRLTLHTEGKKANYKDTRKFGTFKFFKNNPDGLEKKLNKLGPDMLSEPVPDELFLTKLRKVNHYNICKAIMQQTVIAGVGNYIKAEALYKARINPHAKVEDLSDDNLKDLNKQIKSVIYSSFANRGATFRDYVMPDGDVGTYAFQFEVYSKSSDPYMNRVVREETPDKRTTHWVPEIQTIGRTTELVETPLTAQSALV